MATEATEPKPKPGANWFDWRLSSDSGEVWLFPGINPATAAFPLSKRQDAKTQENAAHWQETMQCEEPEWRWSRG